MVEKVPQVSTPVVVIVAFDDLTSIVKLCVRRIPQLLVVTVICQRPAAGAVKLPRYKPVLVSPSTMAGWHAPVSSQSVASTSVLDPSENPGARWTLPAPVPDPGLVVVTVMNVGPDTFVNVRASPSGSVPVIA